jgi:hypothetical protein
LDKKRLRQPMKLLPPRFMFKPVSERSEVDPKNWTASGAGIR